MTPATTNRRNGILYGVAAAALFGASTPFAKLLVADQSPVMLAGLLYLGSGFGLAALHLVRRARVATPVVVARRDLPWLGGAIFFGGVLAPVLLLAGLRATPASTSALLLNLEGVFTAALAWFVFRENVDRRIALGMGLILVGGLVLSWPAGGPVRFPWGAAAVVAACLAWGIDNNLTQKVSANDPLVVAGAKGLVAGAVNFGLALALGASLPRPSIVVGALVLGFFGYGLSLSLFVLSLRHLGTARTGAYFSLAPFIGAAVSLPLLGERLGPALIVAACLMGGGVYLHLTEKHAHPHRHKPLEHAHAHEHDDHHRHEHDQDAPPDEAHAHWHVHHPIVHSHHHFPDIHHRHEHALETDDK